MTTKLTGEALATKAKALIAKGYGLSATAIECGYSSEGPNGKEIPSASLFQRALLAAVGFEFSGGSRGASGDSVKIMKTGTVVLSPSRVKQAGIEAGDRLKITFNPTDSSFVLSKIEEPKPEPTSKSDW